MFDNIGEKIKELALSIFVIEVIAAVVSGIFLIFSGGDGLIIGGIITIIVGIAVAYLSVILIYAFGELVENSSIIANYISNEEDSKSCAPLIGKGAESAPGVYITETIGTPGHKIEPDFWRCPRCGKSNHRTTGTCGCGQQKTT